jgi:hypothetical protein
MKSLHPRCKGAMKTGKTQSYRKPEALRKGNKEDEEDCTCIDFDVRWCVSDGDAGSQACEEALWCGLVL